MHRSFDVKSPLYRVSFRQTDVSRFWISIGDGRHSVIVGPPPCFWCVVGKKIVGENLGLIVRFMAEGRTSVDIAQRPDTFTCRFEEFIRFDVTAFVHTDGCLCRTQEICRWPDTGGNEDFLGRYFLQFTGRTVTAGNDLQATALRDGDGLFVEFDIDAIAAERVQDMR